MSCQVEIATATQEAEQRELEESLNEIIKKAVTTKVMCEPG